MADNEISNLVLSRSKSQSVLVGHMLEVTVVSIGRDRVRLAFKGPKSINIVRTELIKARAG